MRRSTFSTVHPEVIWISPPINAGFFYYHSPKERTIDSVLALKDGKAMAADAGPGAAPAPHPFAELAKRRQLDEIQTRDGPATLWTAPTKTEGRCTWLEFQGKEIPVIPCLPKGYEHQAALAYAVQALGGHRILAGECGYAAIQFLHLDGTTRTVTCSNGIVFTDLESADAGGELRALNAKGQPVLGSSTAVPLPTPQRSRGSSGRLRHSGATG